MDSTMEVIALLRRQAELERQLLNASAATFTTERELEATCRRIAQHPRALNAVLQTAQALRRPPEAVSARQVDNWSGAS